jgi:hypothetical protein
VGNCNAPFPPAGTTHFVNAAYTDAELDAKHFRTITSAIASVAGPGAVIAVESGTYTEGVWPKRAMTVVGRCADKVRLLGAGLQVPGVFSRGVKGVTVSGMTLEDHFQGVRAEGGGIITVSDLVIERARLSGIIAYQPGSTVTASRVVVRETKAGSADGAGVGANADAGGLLDLTDIVLARNADVGISATNGAGESKTPSAVTGRRVFIRDTRPTKAAPAGSGVASFDGCSVALEESVIDKTYGFGVLVEIGGAQASFKNSVIRRTLLSTADGIGGGVLAYDGSVVNLDSVSIEGNEQGGIYARGRAQVTITGSSIEGNLPQADGAFGMGLFADQGATVAISKSSFVDNAYYGVAALDPGTQVQARSSLIRGTKRDNNDGLGRGINVENAAAAQLEGVAFVANGDESVFVRGGVKDVSRSQITASQLIVRDTVSRKDGSTGGGIAVQGGALLELDGAAIVRARRAGILLNDLLGPDGSPSEANIAHVVVRDTQAAGDGLGSAKGIAIEGAGVASGGKLTMNACAVSGSEEFGVAVAGKNSSASITSSVIRNTTQQAEGIYGHGVVGLDGTTVLLKNTAIVANRIGAAFESSTAILSSVLVQKNAVGIHVQGKSQLTTVAVAPESPTTDVVTVTDDSQFLDNQTRVGSGAVPLPTNPLSGTSADEEVPKKKK